MIGCATTYTGPTPDLTLKGEAAAREVEKFELRIPGWNGVDTMYMGAANNRYWTSSLEGVIKPVSPDAAKDIERGRLWRNVGWGFIAAALGIAIASNNDSWNWEIPYISSLGVAVGCGIYSAVVTTDGIEEYNRDLRSKLTPHVGYTFTY